MTDKKIMKALECCIKGETRGECEEMGCPAFNRQGCYFYLRTDEDYEGVIYVEIIKDAIDLINRQQAEIERLTAQKLQVIVPLKNCGDSFMVKDARTIRTEAIKEFAERLKEKGAYNSFNELIIFEDMVDTVEKEMTEVQE